MRRYIEPFAMLCVMSIFLMGRTAAAFIMRLARAYDLYPE